MNKKTITLFRNFLFVFGLLLQCNFSISLLAQSRLEVIIEGTTTLPPGEEVRLIATSDLLTNKQVTVASDIISRNGKFKLTYKTNQIELVQLVIRTSKTEFYVAPGHLYQLQVNADPLLFNMLDPTEYGGSLQVKKLNFDTTDLNFKINYFESYFYDALGYYFQRLHQYDKNASDTIKLLVQENFPVQYSPNNFYLSYLYYSIGCIDEIVLHKTPDSLYHYYFDNEYILYDNPAYMRLFKKCYKNYLYLSPQIEKEVLNQHINIVPDYFALFNAVGKNKMLVNERIRELVIIYNLWDFFYREEFNPHNILALLQFINKSTHFPDHQKIIENILEEITQKQIIQAMQEVVLKKENGEKVMVKDFRGKWVYLQFYNIHCLTCMQEMMLVKELRNMYKDSIEFISVSIDLRREDFTAFMKDYAIFDWPFVHFDGQYDWLRNLEVNSLPDNIIINPKGDIVQRYAPGISDKLSEVLARLFYQEEKVPENPMFYRRTKN